MPPGWAIIVVTSKHKDKKCVKERHVASQEGSSTHITLCYDEIDLSLTHSSHDSLTHSSHYSRARSLTLKATNNKTNSSHTHFVNVDECCTSAYSNYLCATHKQLTHLSSASSTE